MGILDKKMETTIGLWGCIGVLGGLGDFVWLVGLLDWGISFGFLGCWVV